ncbi:RT0821/Lpp0805 family surface protein [Parvibaculum sp.]|uniref:RT0821/Lpp0805 family surface protein n=1 Tax=Parvibaculum sp. TaxID=2024848 RepID=UPI0032101869
MKVFKGLAIGALALSLVGCQEGAGPKQNIGTVGGAVLGGLAGSTIGGGTGRLWATGAGVLLGGLIGSEIGKSLDRADRQYMADRTQYALESAPSGQAVEWRNPDSGHYGSVTPQRAYQDNGSYCREYTQTVNIGGKTERAYGTACRQPDGSWQIVNQ